jgi:hypothetical protein
MHKNGISSRKSPEKVRFSPENAEFSPEKVRFSPEKDAFSPENRENRPKNGEMRFNSAREIISTGYLGRENSAFGRFWRSNLRFFGIFF